MNEETPGARLGKRPVFLVAGLSGAGMMTAMRALEDMGYEAVSGLRLGMVEALVDFGQPEGRPLAVSVETRAGDFSASAAVLLIARLRARAELDFCVLFLECRTDVLARRYTELRRHHPGATNGVLIFDAIESERKLLEPLYQAASRVLDTSNLSMNSLRQALRELCGSPGAIGLHVHVMSFSYRHGVPGNADYVYDARVLTNPYYDGQLREQTGQDPAVGAFIQNDPNFKPFFDNITGILGLVLPIFHKNGRGDLTIAFGCTGGQHRSVLMAEAIAAWLQNNAPYPVSLRHDGLEKARQKT